MSASIKTTLTKFLVFPNRKPLTEEEAAEGQPCVKCEKRGYFWTEKGVMCNSHYVEWAERA